MPNRSLMGNNYGVQNTYPGRTSSISTRGPNDGTAGTGRGDRMSGVGAMSNAVTKPQPRKRKMKVKSMASRGTTPMGGKPMGRMSLPLQGYKPTMGSSGMGRGMKPKKRTML